MNPLAGSKIRIVIPYHQGKTYIERCLNSLGSSTCSVDEVIIVDNCPESPVQTPFPISGNSQLTILRTRPSIGFGRACNIGIDHALSQETGVVILLNQDACVLPETVGQLADALFDSAEILASFPLMLDYEMKSMHPRYLDYYLVRYKEFLRDLILHQPKKSYEIGPSDANGSCVALKANILRKLVHFDPIYWMYGEENDMFSRAFALGYRFVLVPAAKVGHRHSNYLDRSSNPVRFRTLHRYALQVKLLKDPSEHPVRACLNMLWHTLLSYYRCYRQLGLPMLRSAIASDFKLVKNIRLALQHRSAEELQKSITRQMQVDKNIDLH